jgi:hypothetical protein
MRALRATGFGAELRQRMATCLQRFGAFWDHAGLILVEQEQQMRSLRLGHSLAVAVALSLTLLIVGVIGLGVAIR